MGILDGFCVACKEHSIPINIREQFMCLENEKLYPNGITNDKLVPDCLKYNIQGICVQCANKKYLRSDNRCANQCQAANIGSYFKI